MKIKSKKFIYGFIAGLIVAWIASGLFCGTERVEFEYMPGPEESIYKIDKATGDLFWVVGDTVTRVESVDNKTNRTER